MRLFRKSYWILLLLVTSTTAWGSCEANLVAALQQFQDNFSTTAQAPVRKSPPLKLVQIEPTLIYLGASEVLRTDAHTHFFPGLKPYQKQWVLSVKETHLRQNFNLAKDVGGLVGAEGWDAFKVGAFAHMGLQRYSTEESYFAPLNRQNPEYRLLKWRMREVFEDYRRRNIVTDVEVDELARLEDELDLARSMYVFFSDPETERTKMMIRVYDGSIHPNSTSLPETLNPETAALPIEREYGKFGLKLIEREQLGGQAKVLELGRLDKSSDVVGDLTPLLALAVRQIVSRHLTFLSDSPVIYVEAKPIGARLYKSKFGFKTAFTAEELSRLTGVKTDRQILKISFYDFLLAQGYVPMTFPTLKSED